MPAPYLVQSLPDFGVGDAADPMRTITRKRHYVPQIWPTSLTPLTEKQREKLLDKHCSSRGRKHDFSVLTRRGMACLWCKMLESGE